MYLQRLIKLSSETEDQPQEYIRIKDALKIKADSTHNIFVRGKSLVDNVGIIDDVTTEEEAAQNRKNKIDGTVEGEENGNQSGHNLTS